MFQSCKVNHFIESQPTLYRLNTQSEIQTDSAIQALITPYKKQLDDEMNSVIGTLGHDLEKAKPESTMGNWFADLLHFQTEKILGKAIDFAFVNYGGMRINSIPAGPLTKGKVFELMPFDNLVVVVYLDADNLKKLFDKMAEDGGWPISKQARYTIESDRATNIRIKGQPIDPNKTYSVSMSDYIADGGGNCDFLIDLKRASTATLLRDMILQYAAEQTASGKKLETVLDNRVTTTDQ